MLRSDKLEEIEIPKELAEFSFKMVKGFLKEYHLQQHYKANILDNYPSSTEYGLKWLVVSCYLQGLSDANKVLKE